MSETADILTLDPKQRLSRDLREAAKMLTADEAKYLVDRFYQMQEDRIRVTNQVRSQIDEDTGETTEPHAVMRWLADQTANLESQIRVALNQYTLAHPVGKWSQSIVGIGPVLAAGLLAHIDITKAQTVGNIWSFAGANPNVVWEKGERRPWNARLKVLRWKIGESFTKVQNNDGDFYGKIYARRKDYETKKNEAGDYADQARLALETKKFRKDTTAKTCYEKGILPPGRIHLRAQRYAVKLFLAHWHHVAYFNHYRKHPPKPYVMAILGHIHYIQVPNWPFGEENSYPFRDEGMVEAVHSERPKKAERAVVVESPVNAERAGKKKRPVSGE